LPGDRRYKEQYRKKLRASGNGGAKKLHPFIRRAIRYFRKTVA
jgi:hypothetical protein